MKAKIGIAYAVLLMISIGLQAQKKISGQTIYNQEPLSGVNVVILKENSSYVTAVETDRDGFYEIENMKPGSYKLLFSLIGYEKKTIDINIISEDLKMPVTVLEMEPFTMNEVTVKAKRPAFKSEPGKTTVTLSVASIGSDGSLLNALGNFGNIDLE